MTDSHEVERLSEVLSCPFCGASPVWRTNRYGGTLGCENGECYAQPFVGAEDHDDAIAAWNRRALLNDINRKPTPEGK